MIFIVLLFGYLIQKEKEKESINPKSASQTNPLQASSTQTSDSSTANYRGTPFSLHQSLNLILKFIQLLSTVPLTSRFETFIWFTRFFCSVSNSFFLCILNFILISLTRLHYPSVLLFASIWNNQLVLTHFDLLFSYLHFVILLHFLCFWLICEKFRIFLFNCLLLLCCYWWLEWHSLFRWSKSSSKLSALTWSWFSRLKDG